MNTVMDPKLLSISTKRDSIYTFLRIAFNEPLSLEIVKQWKEGLSQEFLEVITEDNENLHRFFEDLRMMEPTDIYQREKDSFLATFDILNKKGRIPAPPWESVYVTKDHALFGEPVLQIRRKLNEFGFQFVKENKEPEDHISIELEFMSLLIHFTANSFREGNRYEYERGVYTQYWLMKEHLNKWIKPFAQAIHTSAATPFYKGIAELLCLFAAEDFEYIKSLKEELENE